MKNTNPTTGRPTKYTPEIAQEILERIADGEYLKDICAEEGMPAARTVRGWAIDDPDGFAARYERARALSWEEEADNIKRISDDASGDYAKDADGKMIANTENVHRSRLRVDARKWLLSKLLARYSDRVQTQLTGPNGGPVQMQAVPFDLSKLSVEDLRALEAMLERAALPAPQ